MLCWARKKTSFNGFWPEAGLGCKICVSGTLLSTLAKHGWLEGPFGLEKQAPHSQQLSYRRC